MGHTRQFRAPVALVLSTAMAVTAGPVGAAAAATDGGWGPVRHVSGSAADVFDLDLTAHGDRQLAVWVRSARGASELVAAVKRPVGTWGTPEAVPRSRGAVEAEVGFAGHGRALAVWLSGRTVRAAVFHRSSGRWSPPAVLHRTPAGSRQGVFPRYLQLDVNRRGRAVVAWQTVDDDRDGVHAASRAQAVVGDASGRWAAVKTLSRRSSDALRPEVAVGSGGRATVVWAERTGSRWQVRAASRAGWQPWGRARPLTRPAMNPRLPHLAALPDGRLAVAWAFSSAAGSGIRLRQWTRARGWGGATTLRRARSTGWADVAMHRSGRVTLVWSGQSGAVWSAELNAAGRWRRTRVAAAGSVFSDLVLVGNRAGDALVAWVSVAGGSHPLQAAYRPRGGDWRGVENLSGAGDAWGPALELTRSGVATALWAQSSAAGAARQVQVRYYTPRRAAQR